MITGAENLIISEQANYGKTASLGLVNTQAYREAAIYYTKHGRYDDGVKGTLHYERYWDREQKRVLNGYSVGGQAITGNHYLYLNYCPIMLVPEKYRNMTEDELVRRKVVKQEMLPDFWDEDYVIFKSWDIAINGITMEDYLSLPIEIPIELDKENMAGGHHHLWLKARGMGASYKGAVLPIKNQFFIKDSKTFIIANNQDYLLGDGIFMKYISYKNFLNSKCGGFQRNFSLQGTKDMEYRCSRWVINEQGLSEERGKRSIVKGIVLAGNANKARGNRGDILWEEFGSNSIVDTAWEQAQSSVEEDGYVYAFMSGFGTGGDDKGGMFPLTKMFYDPRANNILRYRNKWDDGYGLGACAYFTPAYRSIAYKDKDGNSDERMGRLYFDKVREEKRNAKDPTSLPKHQAEKPYMPKEALRRVGRNIFCVEELEAHLKQLEATNIDYDVVKCGTMKAIDFNKVEFELNNKLRGYDEYPVLADHNKTGCVCILHNPFRYSNGVVPKNLYRISVDGYTHDESTGNSIGDVRVMENHNNLTPYKGDKLVAWYAARPMTQDDFNQVLFNMAIYYNAEISFENDQPAGIVGFAKIGRVKGYPYMNYIAKEFELAYDDKLATANGKVNRKFGMHMGSGKDDPRKAQGDLYIKEWLLRLRWNGQANYTTLMDRGIIKELIAYDGEKNVDRVSSFRISMYHEREFLYANKQTAQKEVDDFFNRRLFQTSYN